MKKLLILLAITCQLATGLSKRPSTALFKKTPVMLALDSTQVPVDEAVRNLIARGVRLHFRFSQRDGQIVCSEVVYAQGKIQNYYIAVGMHGHSPTEDPPEDPPHVIRFKEARALLEVEAQRQLERRQAQRDRWSITRVSWIIAVLRAQPAKPTT